MARLKNPKHEAVAQAFVAGAERVGWKAYAAAYPAASQHAAETAWSRLLKGAEFSARLAELEAAVEAAAIAKGVMSRQEVLLELSCLGRANLQDFVAVNADTGAGVIAALQTLPRTVAAAVAEMTVDTYLDGAGDSAREVKRVRLKLHDKRGALRDLGAHYKLFTERHEHAGANGGPIAMRAEEPLDELELARRIAFALELGARAAKPAAKARKR